ncbi:AraC family transcriptional regulator [Staphylococcus canis]|uniref:AraC family transcriptional regulator n=1 Tax=Staphylococcus canis TaxID=2724942 RepID=A0ABS0T6C3_9STAP|nr:AraC family transcriptional regulator [Staphylococcus canis]MBI5974289.1 AraC family transcriptional regulator [Staphylococcus canis]
MQLMWKIFSKDHLDANVDECGIEVGTEQSKYQYVVTKPAVLHIVTSGSGFFEYQHKRYHLKCGDIFLLKRGMSVNYYAASDDPWTYYWVGFSGDVALEYLNRTILNERYVIQNQNTTDVNKMIYKMCQRAISYDVKASDDILHLSELYELLYLLQRHFPKRFEIIESDTNKTVRSALQYINQNYMKPIKVQDVAQHVNVSRSYLYKIFKNHIHQSPQQYLIHLRMYHAARLIKQHHKQNQEIAYLVGYQDPLRFAKAFKKHFGMTATAYRRKTISTQNKG